MTDVVSLINALVAIICMCSYLIALVLVIAIIVKAAGRGGDA